MSAIDRVLDRMPRVKQTRPHNFMAGCLICQSKSGRPISVRETDQGQILLYAFCGCSTEDLLAAMGLKLADLYDAPLACDLPPIRGGLAAREVLELVATEITVAVLLVQDAAVRNLRPDEADRLLLAASRLGKAQGLLNAR